MHQQQREITRGYREIGSGTFSKVYRKGKANNVLIVSNDPVKECMSMGWFPESRLFPKIEFVSTGQDDNKVYKAKCYPKVTAPKKQLNAKAYELYTTLAELFCHTSIRERERKGQTRYEYWYERFESLPAKYNSVKRHLQHALDALTNYGSDICFEISPRNISVTKTGRLILLDCFFMRSKLMAVLS